jgi:hypothetical protein
MFWQQPAIWAVIVMAAIFIGFRMASTWRDAAAAADYSAHEALTTEICDLLAAIQPGQPYPASLTELPLTFPDGGDHRLLERFEYHSTGTSCTLKTVLEWRGGAPEVIVRTFPSQVDI